MQRAEPFTTVAGAGASSNRGAWISVAAHGVMMAVALGVLHRAPRIVPYKLPGTAHGVEFLASYSPGSATEARSDEVKQKTVAPKQAALAHPVLSAPRQVEAQAASVETGAKSSSLSGIGEGDINIALQQYFPYPKPDLSALPHGTRGDVILDAVVDQDGKIAELTLVQGLGPAIDDVVIATVKQWSYIPATKDGVPVASKQELHFHYERG